MKKIISKSQKDTRQVAEKLAKEIKPGTIVLLKGALGSGKTTFVQGFAHALGIKLPVSSPTFVLIKSYPLPDKSAQVFHLDLYRLNSQAELEDLGIEDILTDKNNFTLIEWPELIEKWLPEKAVEISFTPGNSPEERIIQINK